MAHPEDSDGAFVEFYNGIHALTKEQEAQTRLAQHYCPVGHKTKTVGCRMYCHDCKNWLHYHQTRTTKELQRCRTCLFLGCLCDDLAGD